MVTTPVDAARIPVITLSQSEIEEIEEEIAAGLLPADFLERHAEAVRKNVFGFDFQTDANGHPIEQGRGSPFNQTRQSIDAYRKWGRDDPDYERNLGRMEKELVASDARRKAKAQADSAGRKVVSRR